MGRFLFLSVIITVFALGYVRQQTEIVRCGYEVTQKQKLLKELVDEHNILVYNINSLKSFKNLEPILFSKEENFQIPESYQIVRLVVASSKQETPKLEINKRPNLFISLFNLKSQAEAKTIK